MNKIKKTLICLLIVVVLLMIVFWTVSYAYCEYLTHQYADELRTACQDNTMLIEPKFIKVLQYSETSAQVYYVTINSGSGNILYLSKSYVSNIWKVDSWETVWSTTGSADGMVWPYIR